MQWIRDYKPDLEVTRLFRRALVITLAGNVILAVGKGAAAYFSGSVALYADAANSISDVLYSLLMVLGLRMALQPPDISHPQGHGRFEPIVGLAVAAAMTFAGYEAGRTAVERFLIGGMDVALMNEMIEHKSLLSRFVNQGLAMSRNLQQEISAETFVILVSARSQV